MSETLSVVVEYSAYGGTIVEQCADVAPEECKEVVIARNTNKPRRIGGRAGSV